MAKKTPFYDRNVEIGGRMVEFAGYDMPVQYSSIIKEHLTTRRTAGIFDLSHMGEFWVQGDDVIEAIDKLVTNDVSKLVNGQALYSPMCLASGGIVDDILIYRINAKTIMLVVNASNIEKDWRHLSSMLPDTVNFTDKSEHTGLIAIQGPKSLEILSRVVDVNLALVEFYHFITNATIAGQKVLISRTGYTGELGFEIYIEDDQDQLAVWDAIYPGIVEAGGSAVGLGARDTLRLEMKYCLYGNDIDETTSPLEAGIGWTVKLKRQEDFVGKSVLVLQKEEDVSRKLIGFVMDDKGIPRHNYDVYAEDNKVGYVTSGSYSPSLDTNIGLAYVDVPHNKTGTEISIEIRGKMKKATIVKMPFIEK